MDIVERLKAKPPKGFVKAPLMIEAATEIERLREALGRIAKHDLQAIALDALSPNIRRTQKEKE